MERTARIQIIIGISLVVAAILIVVSAYSLLMGPEKSPQEEALQAVQDEQHTVVLIAARSMPRGTRLVPADALPLTIVGDPPVDALLDGAIVNELTAMEDIEQGQLLMGAMLSDKPYAAGLSALVEDGYRAVAIRVNDEVAVASFIRPGDKVDVHVVLRENSLVDERQRRALAGDDNEPVVAPEGDESESHVLLHNVEVLTVGQQVQGQDKPLSGGYNTVTVLVTPDEASTLALGRRLGEFSLSLRGPEDEVTTADRTITLDELRGADAIAKKRAMALRQRREKKVETHKVQIINGGSASTVELEGAR